MFKKIILWVLGIIAGIIILLFFAVRGIFKGSWQVLAFLCQRQYLELKRLCESGTAAELQSFLESHPGAGEYVIYTRRGRATAFITSLFRLPSPLAVAGRANNLAVIPVLLGNGASPEIRSVSEKQTPAEEAIGEPDKMRALCGGKTWWAEHGVDNNAALASAVKAANFRGILWHTLRGAELTDCKELCQPEFLSLPRVMKEFVCRFALCEKQQEDYPAVQKQLLLMVQELPRKRNPAGNGKDYRRKNAREMADVLQKSQRPLPSVDEGEAEKLLLSTGILGRAQMLGMLNNLFPGAKRFSLLKHFLGRPLASDDREAVETMVDLLLCSILAEIDA